MQQSSGALFACYLMLKFPTVLLEFIVFTINAFRGKENTGAQKLFTRFFSKKLRTPYIRRIFNGQDFFGGLEFFKNHLKNFLTKQEKKLGWVHQIFLRASTTSVYAPAYM